MSAVHRNAHRFEVEPSCIALASAIGLALALCATPATAQVAVNPKGTGDFLIFPYFDVARELNPLSFAQDAQDTLIEITNPDAGRTIAALGGGAIGAQVARVRFFQGTSGTEVLNLDVVIPCGGTWTAKIEQGPDFRPRVVTSSPVVTASAGTNFATAALPAPVPLEISLPVATENQRGFIEVFAEETVRCEAAAGGGGSLTWTRLDAGSAYAAPTRLSGEALVVRVGAGVAESYSALALERLANTIHSVWSAAGPRIGTCGAASPTHCFQQVNFALRQARAWPSFDTNPDIGASTRVVLTLPTKGEACALASYATGPSDAPFTSCAGPEVIDFQVVPRAGAGASPPFHGAALVPHATTLYRVGGAPGVSLPTGGAVSGAYELDFSAAGEGLAATAMCGVLQDGYTGKPVVVLELREYLNGAVGGTYGVSAYAPGIEIPPASLYSPPA